MTQHEATEQVRGYLAHTGGAEVSGACGMYEGLGRRVSLAMIRKALRELGAVIVRGGWSPYDCTEAPNAYRPFAFYRLPKPQCVDSADVFDGGAR